MCRSCCMPLTANGCAGLLPRIEYWSGQRNVLSDSLTLLNCAGHFPGSTALYWREGCTAAVRCRRAMRYRWCRTDAM